LPPELLLVTLRYRGEAQAVRRGVREQPPKQKSGADERTPIESL
jgi:hypothetical protein